MREINELILRKLDEYPSTTREIAKSALELAEKGLSDSTIAEQLSSVIRKLSTEGGEDVDTA